jgi:hypothetical protein
MPREDQKYPPAHAAEQRAMLASLLRLEVTLGDVLHAVHTLT